MKNVSFQSRLRLFLFVGVCFLLSCKSETNSYNDVIKEAASKREMESLAKVHPSPLLEETKDTTIAESDMTKTPMPNIVKKEIKEGMKIEKIATKSTPKPKLRERGILAFEEFVYEFGVITEGDIVKHDFYFKNTGKAPIIVKSATATCGCTIPSYPFIPIDPGEKGYIGVTYNSVGKSGIQTPIITVISNATQKIVKLKFTGTVVEKVKESQEGPDTTSALPQ
ncbi:MAG: DUF1573 domain-containing protein [Saprospiraceae bacterium]